MVTGDAVVVSNSGQLGIVVSSARYKRDIRDMGNSSEALRKLRPVTFRYKDDPSQQSHDVDGKVLSVHYHELVPMLLNEIQKLSSTCLRSSAASNHRPSSRSTGRRTQSTYDRKRRPSL
jgi:hypothetical protein